MKTLQLITCCLLLGLGLVSCSKEDGISTPGMDLGRELAGTYSGLYSSPLTPKDENYQITITRIDEHNVRITVPDFGAFDTEVLSHLGNANLLSSSFERKDLLDLVYERDTRHLTFVRYTKTLSGEDAELVFDGFKK